MAGQSEAAAKYKRTIEKYRVPDAILAKQDCNGYHLTIDITRAQCSAKKDTFSLKAASAPGKNAILELVGCGTMKWNRKYLISISASRFSGC